jgi:hypothetical protein
MQQRQNNGLRKRPSSVQGHDQVWVRTSKQIAELPGILRAQYSQVRLVPILGLRRGRCALVERWWRRRRRSRGVGCLWRSNPCRSKPGSVHDRGLGLLLEGLRVRRWRWIDRRKILLAEVGRVHRSLSAGSRRIVALQLVMKSRDRARRRVHAHELDLICQ